MKNLAWISFLLSFTSTALFFLWPDIPKWIIPLPAFAGWMIGFAIVKMFTRPLDITASYIAIICYGITIDLICGTHGLFSVALLFLSFTFSLRTMLIKKIGYVKQQWIEPTVLSAGIIIYFVTNIFMHAGWYGWFFPGLILLFVLFGLSLSMKEMAAFKKGKSHDLKIGVGTTAPDFSLPDENGKNVSLSEFKEKQNALLLFVRGDWCPTCHIMLRTYEKNNDQFKKKNVVVLAIGPDPQGVNKEMVEKLSLSFRILADDKQEALNLYGIQFLEPMMGQKYEIGSPLPASILVDKKGIVRHLCRADRAEEFLNTMQIFSVLEKLDA